MLDVVEEEVGVCREEGDEIGISIDDMVNDLGGPSERVIFGEGQIYKVQEIFVL